MNCDSVLRGGSFQAFHVVAESYYEQLYSTAKARSPAKALGWAIYQQTDVSQRPPPKKKKAGSLESTTFPLLAGEIHCK